MEVSEANKRMDSLVTSSPGNSRPRLLHSWGSSLLSMAHKIYTKAAESNTPIASLARALSYVATPILWLYPIHHQWLATLSFVDLQILAVEKIAMAVFPPSTYIFTKVDEIALLGQSLPQKLDDAMDRISTLFSKCDVAERDEVAEMERGEEEIAKLAHDKDVWKDDIRCDVAERDDMAEGERGADEIAKLAHDKDERKNDVAKGKLTHDKDERKNDVAKGEGGKEEIAKLAHDKDERKNDVAKGKLAHDKDERKNDVAKGERGADEIAKLAHDKDERKNDVAKSERRADEIAKGVWKDDVREVEDTCREIIGALDEMGMVLEKKAAGGNVEETAVVAESGDGDVVTKDPILELFDERWQLKPIKER